ncbi:alkaline phosphatase [Salinimonas marina]|uniref:Alkaline phosphatase n=1 Tax=Salinimonas marina TaxID=2785918 RepID=A0A7S9DXK6_9ALTE|nr:alkaline phosphatase [Salinimonas marina]QPG05125.1 alkaline phosphatase [Salinimonas marina]
MILIQLALSAGANAAMQPKRIILLIGDGMGQQQATALRHFKARHNNDTSLMWDALTRGEVSTSPVDSAAITDSAAAATAYATGRKTSKGFIGVDAQGQPLSTVVEKAKQQGWNTGLITTTQINHATPASFLAHNSSRNNYAAIADEYIDATIANKFKFDLLMGAAEPTLNAQIVTWWAN